jgi:pimeloyl-ACP methyl ester carboxylesterase
MNAPCAGATRLRYNSHLNTTGLIWIGFVLIFVGCAGNKWAQIRETPQNPLTRRLNMFYGDQWKASERTRQVLRLYNFEDRLKESDGRAMLKDFQPIVEQEPTHEKLLAFSELSYLTAAKIETKEPPAAIDLYGTSVVYAYRYLFDQKSGDPLNPYDPQFRSACDLYNGSLEAAMRLICKEKGIQPGQTYTVKTASGELNFQVTIKGNRWKNEDFDHFDFVSDYKLTGLRNHYRTYGLGVPLIAVRKSYEGQSKADRYYPIDLSFPVTALLRPAQVDKGLQNSKTIVNAVLEIYDPLTATDIAINGYQVPLESDLSTPLAHYLSKPQLQQLATVGLLRPDLMLKKIDPGREDPIMGLYMFEPYQPGKIPVLMVHGLWSSPITWMQMFNDLRNDPQIRERYQFWFYLYPTGHPFWLSASMLRDDLAEVRRRLDPKHSDLAMDQMVLIGHSMGGLLARLQTLNSRDEFWNLMTDAPFDQLQAEPKAKEQIGQVFFFRPNPSIRRVITIGTPHRGSDMSNDMTQWLTSKLITLPGQLIGGKQELIAQNKSILKNRRLLEIETSIDSLSPSSPFFDTMVNAQRAPWVKYHNVIGLVPNDGFLGRLAAGTDGVVSESSAKMDDVESELVVEADHTTVHANPRTVQEVRRILFSHLEELAQYPAKPPVHLARGAKKQSQAAANTQHPVQPTSFVSPGDRFTPSVSPAINRQ